MSMTVTKITNVTHVQSYQLFVYISTYLMNCLFTGLKHVKKFKKEPESDIPRLCHVCGEQAGKHSYYGGQVCPSCRAFFRRSVQSK